MADIEMELDLAQDENVDLDITSQPDEDLIDYDKDMGETIQEGDTWFFEQDSHETMTQDRGDAAVAVGDVDMAEEVEDHAGHAEPADAMQHSSTNDEVMASDQAPEAGSPSVNTGYQDQEFEETTWNLAEEESQTQQRDEEIADTRADDVAEIDYDIIDGGEVQDLDYQELAENTNDSEDHLGPELDTANATATGSVDDANAIGTVEEGPRTDETRHAQREHDHEEIDGLDLQVTGRIVEHEGQEARSLAGGQVVDPPIAVEEGSASQQDAHVPEEALLDVQSPVNNTDDQSQLVEVSVLNKAEAESERVDGRFDEGTVAAEVLEEPQLSESIEDITHEELAAPEDRDPATLEVADHDHETKDLEDEAGSDYPTITVNYAGEDYSCFSSGTNGFFTEVALLEEPIAAILSKFRLELSEELASEDDLVWHIDELGLEFSESMDASATASLTLRQILEVFDLLSKNQDPDSSRPLYTYLFTRSNAARRFDTLVESATAGKGLDEVIHLFEIPSIPPTGLEETSNLLERGENGLSEYESPDGHSEGGNEPNGEGPAEEERDDTASASVPPDEGSAPDALGDLVEDVVHQPELGDAQASTNVGSGNPEPGQVRPEGARPMEDGAGKDRETPATDNAALDPTGPPIQAGSPYFNVNIGGGDDENGDGDELDTGVGYESDGYEKAGEGDSHDGLDEPHIQADSDEESPSQSNTITGDVAPAADVDNAGQSESVFPNEDELSEIDWAEEPEVGSEANQSPTAAASKRARADEDVDEGEEQDTKRQRS